MYLIWVLSFIGDLRFNFKSEYVQDGWGKGSGVGLGGYQPGVYVPVKFSLSKFCMGTHLSCRMKLYEVLYLLFQKKKSTIEVLESLEKVQFSFL